MLQVLYGKEDRKGIFLQAGEHPVGVPSINELCDDCVEGLSSGENEE